MKKGFTMIELIFVIVILGILASVAIPRLAGTRADAEISATIGNLRTLLSDAATYYTVKGDFPTGTNWGDFTSVAVKTSAGASAASTTAVTEVYFPVGGVADCIGVKVVNKTGDKPAHFKFKPKEGATGTCQQVIDAKSVDAFVKAKMTYATKKEDGTATTGEEANAMAIGSTAAVYDATK